MKKAQIWSEVESYSRSAPKSCSFFRTFLFNIKIKAGLLSVCQFVVFICAPVWGGHLITGDKKVENTKLLFSSFYLCSSWRWTFVLCWNSFHWHYPDISAPLWTLLLLLLARYLLCLKKMIHHIVAMVSLVPIEEELCIFHENFVAKNSCKLARVKTWIWIWPAMIWNGYDPLKWLGYERQWFERTWIWPDEMTCSTITLKILFRLV